MAITLQAIQRTKLTLATYVPITPGISAGQVMVIKDLRFSNYGGAAIAVTAQFAGALAVVLVKSVAASDTYIDSGELVLVAGQSLEAKLSLGGTVDCVVSGFLRDQ